MELVYGLRKFRLKVGLELETLRMICKVNILGFILFPLHKSASVSLVINPISASTLNKMPSY